MKRKSEVLRRRLLFLVGALLLLTAILAAAQAVYAKSAYGIFGPAQRGAPHLETHHRGEPLNVLFFLPVASGTRAFLVRYITTLNGRQVVAYSLGGSEVQGLLEHFSRFPFPPFLRENGKLDVVGWINEKMGIPVHHIVFVKNRCWPQYSWNRQVETNPLLELAAAYPGTLTATLPPTPAISTDLLKGSLETDSRLSFRHVLSLLGEIETAREEIELDLVPFDGNGKPPAISRGVHEGESEPWLLELLGYPGTSALNQKKENPHGRFNRNCLVTFEPDSMRGKLPPAPLGQVIYRGNPSLKRVALTIDDGWNADMRILDLLQSWKIKYTAFIPGRLIDADYPPGLVQRVYESGGELCSHTYTHRIMRNLPEPVFLEELWRSEQAICRITHEVYPYIRFSGGDYDVPAVAWAAREGFWVVNWTIDSLDTRQGVSANAQVDYILSNLEPGAILLFHFGGYNTYGVMARVIPEIQRRGYKVTSLSRVLEGTPFRLDRE